MITLKYSKDVPPVEEMKGGDGNENASYGCFHLTDSWWFELGPVGPF